MQSTHTSSSEQPTAILSVQPGEGLGAETVLSELLNGWAPENSPLLVIAPPDSRVYDAAKANQHATLDWSASRDAIKDNLQAANRVRGALKKEGVRQIHAWTARGFESASFLGKTCRIPVMGTLHDHPTATFHGPMRQRIIKSSANRFAQLGCVSQAVVDACKTSGFRCPMKVLHNGLADLPVPERTEEKRLRIGFLGMYAEWKGFDLVAPWIDALAGDPVRWHLYGEVHPDVQPLVDQLRAKNVTLKGHQPTSDIFAEIDVLVHASSQFDPLPTVLIEAARAGIPAIAANVGGSSEIVRHDQTGLRFDPAHPSSGLSELHCLVDDSSQRKRLGDQARDHFENHFRVGRMVERYNAFWTSGT